MDNQSPKFEVVSLETHANKSWKKSENFRQASTQNLIPIAGMELMRVIPMMPLAFAILGEVLTLVGIASPMPGQNFFVDQNGRWLGSYLPISLRVFPFRLVKPDENSEPILCVAEGSNLVQDGNQGVPFFNSDGSPSSETMEMLKLLVDVNNSSERTNAAIQALNDAGVVQPWALKIQSEKGLAQVDGLSRIDESALNSLDAETLYNLRQKGALNVAYAQMFSSGQLSVLGEMAKRTGKGIAESAPSDLQEGYFSKNETISFERLG